MKSQAIQHHNISGVMPHLAVKAGHLPARTETGIGGLMPWANRLWFVTYVAHKQGTGSGTGLFSIDDGMNLTKHPESVVGTYANRMIHRESNQLFIGPHFIATPEVPSAEARETCRAKAEEEGREFRDLDGSLRLLRMLLHGDWPTDEFLVVSPGRRIRMIGDWDRIVESESVPSPAPEIP